MNINLDIGDTILTGRFKNKAVVAKQFGKDAKGQPTVNGRPMLKFRIKKLMQNIFPTEQNLKEQKIRKIIRQKIGEILDSAINENVSEGRLSKSQMAFMQNQLILKRGDIITYDQYFKFGKVSRDEKAKVVAIHGHRVLLDNSMELDLRTYPIKKVNNKVYDRDTSMYDDKMMR